MGRYGERKKVPLTITIDKQISESLRKVKKGSVSGMVNDFLVMIVRQFDPGPLSPLIYDLHDLLKRHRKNAEISGDSQKIACIEYLESQLLPYYELADVPVDDNPDAACQAPKPEGSVTLKRASELLSESEQSQHDYSWYSIPRICHGIPMLYSRKESAWTCSSCGSRYDED